ncbi:flagellar biosynthetic protein FliQ [Sulfobacillus harzensis]|uniref:Flagellar biosynthetic protein FliQ n=1 Tax=Sulfobacillus harzensis TaxID=2729629 RepID=A0A7Y0L4B9_9FIRM|nr:flagellar biosynthetic protein FliQ [Sulfobacillus harzensis]NMP23067.1 flagellar biosynthetic protein FliQ [Sulfobacillus harzensis]
MFDHALQLSQSAMITAGIVLLPLLAAALLVGLLVGIFQATTQIQEMTLSFLPKLVALGVILYIGGPWFLRILVSFMQRDLSSFWQTGYLP